MKASRREETGLDARADSPEGEKRDFFALPGADALWGLLMAAYTALVWYLAWAPPGETLLENLIFRVGCGAFGLWGASVTIRILKRTLTRGPVLSFTEAGILDRSAVGPPVFVPWDEVVSIQSGSRGPPNLEIRVKDRSALNLGLVRRFVRRMIRQTKDADVVIPASFLSVPAETVVSLAHELNESRLLAETRQLRMDQGIGPGKKETDVESEA
jgi:hypothetical protein